MSEINPEVKRLIEENALALATLDEEGKPHCIAVGYAKVVSKNQILVTDNYMVETRKNLEKNNNVALAVWNKNWQENCVGYEMQGKAEYFKEGRWRDEVKKMPENRGLSAKGAILVTIHKIKKLA